MWLLLACPPPAALEEPGGCCAYTCSDGYVFEMGAQPQNACDLEAEMVCVEEREVEVVEVRWDPRCTARTEEP